MAGDNRHVPLLSLAEAWASDAGMPPEMVLRNLCDWALVGAFPDGTLVTPVGDKVDPFDIYVSGKRIGAEFGRVTFNGWELLNPEWGIELLAGVLVSEPGVRAYCNHTDTAVPSLLRGFGRFFPTALVKHLAPPACPEAEEHAAKHHARQLAVAEIASLRAILAGLHGKPTRLGPGHRAGEHIAIAHWEERWEGHRKRAVSAIRRSGDAQLEQDVQALDSEWASFVSTEMQRQAAAPASSIEPCTQTPEPNHAHGASTPKRAAGRFSPAELAAWYEGWVTDNTEAGTTPSRDEDWAAAKAKLGDDIPRDEVRTLRQRLAPASWQRKGRRKAAEEIGDED